MTATAPWIKNIDAALAILSEVPEFTSVRPFPTDELVAHLSKLFEQKIQLETITKGWTPPSDLFQGMPKDRKVLKIFFTPLHTPVYFATTEQDLKFLMSELLGGQAASAPFFESSTIMGFYHYLGLEVLSIIDQHKFAEDLIPRQEEAGVDFEKEISKCDCYLIDVHAKGGTSTFAGRLFIPVDFRNEWKGHFESFPNPALTKEEREKIAVELSLEVGSSKLSLDEWKSVRPGDLVVLDRATVDVPSGVGKVILSLNGQPLFRGKLTTDGIKLLKYPLYEEVGESMDDQNEEENDLYGDIEESEAAEIEEEKQSFETVSLEETITADKIPILLTAEAGRIRMTAEELMQLSPGSIIDLKVRPEQGIDLVVNGKRVGKGELVKVGEVLGVRILKL